MIDQILSSLKGEMMQKFTGSGEQGIPEDKVNDAAVLAKDNMVGTVQDEVKQGNLSGLMGLFDKNTDVANNPITSNMIMKYAGDLGSKLGLSPDMSQKVAGFAIPFILKNILGKASEQGMNQSSIMSMLGGAGSGDLGDMLKGDIGKTLGGLFK